MISSGFPQLRRRVVRLMLPAAMLPEILSGVFAHHSLQRLRESQHHVVDVALAVAGMRHRDLLGDELVPAVGLPHGVDHHHRIVAAQRGVFAGRPKNGTKVDASPTVAWSERKPTACPSRSTRGTRRTASRSCMMCMPRRSRVRRKYASESGFDMPRAIGCTGTPRAAT